MFDELRKNIHKAQRKGYEVVVYWDPDTFTVCIVSENGDSEEIENLDAGEIMEHLGYRVLKADYVERV